MGYPFPTPRVCVGLSGALDGYQASCRSQSLSSRAGARRFSFFWGWVAAQLGKTRPLLGMGVGGEEGTCLATGCFASPYTDMGWGVGSCPCTLTQAPADHGERWQGGFLSHHQAHSTRAQPRSDLTSQLSTISQAGIR